MSKLLKATGDASKMEVYPGDPLYTPLLELVRLSLGGGQDSFQVLDTTSNGDDREIAIIVQMDGRLVVVKLTVAGFSTFGLAAGDQRV